MKHLHSERSVQTRQFLQKAFFSENIKQKSMDRFNFLTQPPKLVFIEIIMIFVNCSDFIEIIMIFVNCSDFMISK